jgi:polar amino acid transport system permease protein
MEELDILFKYFVFLLHGAFLTLKISAISLVLGLVFGLLGALFKLSRNGLLRSLTTFYIWIIRSTPLLIQLFMIYFGLPQIGINLEPFSAGVLALAINTGAYNAETIRAGMVSIPHGQTEAARSLGMSMWVTTLRIILPQAFRVIMPALGNNFIILIKDTSLVSTITLVELTLTSQRLIGSTYRPFEIYIMAAFLYAFLTTAVSLLISRYEKKTKK